MSTLQRRMCPSLIQSSLSPHALLLAYDVAGGWMLWLPFWASWLDQGWCILYWWCKITVSLWSQLCLRSGLSLALKDDAMWSMVAWTDPDLIVANLSALKHVGHVACVKPLRIQWHCPLENSSRKESLWIPMDVRYLSHWCNVQVCSAVVALVTSQQR